MKAKCKKCGEELRYPKEYEKAEIGCFKCGGQVALIPQVECFETTCPNCEKVNDFSVSDFGQQVQCFYCRQSFIFSEIKIQCPHCDKGYSLKHQFLGKKARCAACREIFVIGEPRKDECPEAFSLEKQVLLEEGAEKQNVFVFKDVRVRRAWLLGCGTIVGSLTNNSGENFQFVSLAIEIFDGKGDIYGVATAHISNLMDGQTKSFEGMIDDLPIKFSWKVYIDGAM